MLGPLTGRRALVVGAGSMGALSAATLVRGRVAELAVANRSPERAQRLAGALRTDGARRSCGPSRWTTSPTSWSARTSWSAAPERSARCCRPRSSRPRCRAAGRPPAGAARPGPAAGRRRCRRRAARGALPGPRSAAGAGRPPRRAQRRRAGPARSSAEEVGWPARRPPGHRRHPDRHRAAGPRRRGRRRRAGPPGRPAARPRRQATRAEVARSVHRVVQTLLHAPTVRVKELAEQPGGGAYADALRELFDLDPAATAAVAADLPAARNQHRRRSRHDRAAAGRAPGAARWPAPRPRRSSPRWPSWGSRSRWSRSSPPATGPPPR